MNVTAHRILLRRKFPPMGVAQVSDFCMWPNGKCELSPQNTLYCVDDAAEKIYLVETPEQVDLTQSAFLFRTQYEQAQQVFSVDYRDFQAQMKKVSTPQSPIFICGIGRSGTTLVHHALNNLPDVASWPEPDVFTQLVRLRLMHASADRMPLLRDCATYFHQHKNFGRVAFKMRSFVTEIIDTLYTAFPDAKILFLYRDCVDWVQSNMRVLTRFPLPDSLLRALLKRVYGDYFPVLHTLNLESLTLVEIIAHIWLAYMQRYQMHCAAGIPMLAIHYDDLKSQSENTLAQIFDFCDLPVAHIQHSLGVFEHDSQAKTAFAQAKLGERFILSDRQILSIEHIALELEPLKNRGF